MSTIRGTVWLWLMLWLRTLLGITRPFCLLCWEMSEVV
ncbi:hypothetical protein LINPERPRIM_LOCUS40121 [Linum perenne]